MYFAPVNPGVFAGCGCGLGSCGCPLCRTAALSGFGSAIPDMPPQAYLFPVKGGVITSTFGPRISPITGEQTDAHGALDIACPKKPCDGTPIFAPTDGVVSFLFPTGGEDKCSGRAIGLRHDDGFSSSYSHLSKINVSRGQRVKRGQAIGLMGSTGCSTGDHLHWRVNGKNGVKIDPLLVVVGRFAFGRKGGVTDGEYVGPGSSTNYPGVIGGVNLLPVALFGAAGFAFWLWRR